MSATLEFRRLMGVSKDKCVKIAEKRRRKDSFEETLTEK